MKVSGGDICDLYDVVCEHRGGNQGDMISKIKPPCVQLSKVDSVLIFGTILFAPAGSYASVRVWATETGTPNLRHALFYT